MVDSYKLEIGNSKELLKNLPDNSIDAIVTDPPYELGFMGKKWDASGIAYDVDLWKECLRVLKPGGHLLAFSGSRTYHRMAVAIEDAGFDIRDQIMWVYGSGFPKSHDVSKAIDKAAGAEREILGPSIHHSKNWKPSNTLRSLNKLYNKDDDGKYITAPATDEAKEWNGWGTALKPAHEPICVARKPLIGTVAENVLQYGTGAINIDGCRVGSEQIKQRVGKNLLKSFSKNAVDQNFRPNDYYANDDGIYVSGSPSGRWPANLIHDGSAEVLAGFPDENEKTPARFFYCAKASKRDRDEGCGELEEKTAGQRTGRAENSAGITGYAGATGPARNYHPTVKPTELMQYLCRLVTPQNGIILDPFTGSGSTGKAAILEGFRFIGFDMQHEYIEIAKARIEFAIQKKNEIEIKKENTLFDE